MVSDAKFEMVSRHRWYSMTPSRRGLSWSTYACTRINGKTVYLHRFVLGLEPGDKRKVDHIDRNGLNCQDENLRICDASQNSGNSVRHRDGSSRYKGVSYDKGRQKWKAQICQDYKNRLIGRFLTEEEAAAAYDREASKVFGQFSRPNGMGTVSGPHS